jgi:hypothetical protein
VTPAPPVAPTAGRVAPSRCTRAIAAAATLALAATAATAAPTREAAEACSREVGDGTVAAHRLDPGCSRFLAGYAAGSVPDWIDAGGSEALHDLALTLPDAAPPSGAAAAGGGAAPTAPLRLDPAAVGPLLAALRTARENRPRSLIERFWAWLQQPTAEAKQAAPPGWARTLARWLERLPHGAARGVFWTLAIVLVAALLALIAAELRASGVLRRLSRRTMPVATGAGDEPPAAVAALGLSDIDRLGAAARAGALLRWTLDGLAQRERLPRDPALTHRELGNRLDAPFDVLFRRFVAQLEPALFGGGRLDDDGYDEARRLAVALQEAGPALR